jgi:hypothetical protein
MIIDAQTYWRNVMSFLRLLLCGILLLLPQGVMAQKVSFRGDHTVLVDGKPFFPIGLYYCYEEFEDHSGKLLQDLRDYGFNTAGYYRWGQPAWQKELELADKAGLKVWIRGINGLAVDSDATEKSLRDQVQQVKTQPALLFWEFQDEPLLNKVPIAEAMRGQEVVKKLDPDHPLLVVEWPGAVSRFKEWNSGRHLCHRSLSDSAQARLWPPAQPRHHADARLSRRHPRSARRSAGGARRARLELGAAQLWPGRLSDSRREPFHGLPGRDPRR